MRRELSLSKPTDTRSTAFFASLSLLILIVIAFIGSCAPSADIELAAGPNGEIFDALNFKNKRLDSKFRIDNDLIRAKEIWLDSADDLSLVFGWSELSLKVRTSGTESCPAYNTETCFLCTVCTPCDVFPTAVFLLPDYLQPFATLTKIDEANNRTLLQTLNNMPVGCRNLDFLTPITIEDKMTYELTNEIFGKEENGVPSTLTLKTRVVTASATATYQLPVAVPYKLDSTPPDEALRFIGRVPIRDVPHIDDRGDRVSEKVLDSNFSPSLRATKVRVVLGTGVPDGQYMVRFDDVALRKARPSRIVPTLSTVDLSANRVNGNLVGPGYSDGNACFVNPTVLDGGFNFLACRTVDARGNISIRPIDLTPTFEIATPQTHLTWVLEYKTVDGLPEVPVFAANEFPVIEFTIE
jgi:hypothetical protein